MPDIKTCIVCLQDFPDIEEFFCRYKKSGKLHAQCRACRNADVRRRREEGPVKKLKDRLKPHISACRDYSRKIPINAISGSDINAMRKIMEDVIEIDHTGAIDSPLFHNLVIRVRQFIEHIKNKKYRTPAYEREGLTEKKCNGCGAYKVISEFRKRGFNRDGSIRYESQCKLCRADSCKKSYQKNIVKRREYGQRRHWENRENRNAKKREYYQINKKEISQIKKRRLLNAKRGNNLL